MREYPKINTIFKRDERGKIIEGQYSCPEFEYLKDNQWLFTEKVDGTNIRGHWDKERVIFGGKTDNAQTPTSLLLTLQELFPVDKLKSKYPDLSFTLYGEGYGARIQKGGGNYISNGVSFVLFDILVYTERHPLGIWLSRENIKDIADNLEIRVVPLIEPPIGTLEDAVDLCRRGFGSNWGDFAAEGIVLRPFTELSGRLGERIITKIKHRDFLVK